MDTDPIKRRFSAVARSVTFKNIVDTHELGKKAVLDIGSAYGEHLVHFGPGSTGLTVSPEEVAYGKQQGLDTRLGNIEEGFNPGKKYDAIFCNNLLEHLLSPHQFLVSARAFLKNDGALILGVPCIPFPSLLMKLKWFRGALATNHINFFTTRTLRLTAERAGWNIHTIRGFHFKAPLLDRMFLSAYPHLYIIATPDPSFTYSEKRKRELAGYGAK